MANEKEKVQTQGKEEKVKEKAPASFQELLEPLAKFGRFAILKNSIRTFVGKSGEQYPGLDNMDPEKRARKDIFLKDAQFTAARKILKIRLQMWKRFLEESKNFDEILSKALERNEILLALMKKNLKRAVDASKDLEKSYRTVASFFSNAEKTKGAKVENIDFVNAALSQINDKDNPRYLEAIANQLEAFYNRLDLMDNYSLMVVPGFLGSTQNIDRIAEVAARNKVMLLTDFVDAESVEDAMTWLDSYRMTGADLYKAYVCVVCNYLVGRQGYEDIDEPVMYIPGSVALAGKLYSNPIQVTSAGVTNGRLKEIDGVRFPMKQTELGDLAEKGVIPMTLDFGKPMAFGDTTLYEGDNPGFKKYSVMRTFDFITKTLKDLLNRYTFRNITPSMIGDIRRQITLFLDSNTGSNKLIQEFEIVNIEKIDVDKVRLNIHITPWFPSKLFEISLTGQEGEAGKTNQWDEKVTSH